MEDLKWVQKLKIFKDGTFSPNQSDSNGKAFQERPFVQTASVPKKFYFRLNIKSWEVAKCIGFRERMQKKLPKNKKTN